MEREYVFLSHMVPYNMKETVYKNSKNNMQDAADALQWHIYNGLCQNLRHGIKVINFLPISSYPQYYKKAVIKESEFITQYSNGNVNIGFCNVKLVRRFSMQMNAYKVLKKCLSSNNTPKILFLYTASNAFLEAIERLKKKYDIKVCIIIADLPNMCSLSSKKSLLTKWYEKISSDHAYELLSSVDYYVLLTKHMAEYMHLDKPYCVMEGIATTSEEFSNPNYDNETKTVFYGGTLHRRFGVLNLVEAFMQITSPEYRLILCGAGDCEREIAEAAQKDSRIKFYGQLPRSEVLKLQSSATVLVNPRQNNEEFTRYSFPSKNLEYLSSGIPTIAYKLDGIPEEYDSYFIYPADNSRDALVAVIEEVCLTSAEVRKRIGLAGRDFVLTNKNDVRQTKRILDLLDYDQY